ncbi:MAG: DUF1365 domain-containing protein [Acidobacteriota bacterium]
MSGDPRAAGGAMASAIYEGRVRHRRFQPHGHAFEYPLFMMYLDLGEIDDLLDRSALASTRRPAPVRFRRRDYLGDPGVPLAEAVRDLVEERSGVRPRGPIRLLTHLRYWGFGFNPVSFYYCFDPAGERVEHVVAEVANTPWNERYSYVLSDPEPRGRSRAMTWEMPKVFHVSPFMDMDMDYRWTFSEPSGKLLVHMENHKPAGKMFDATLTLERTRGMTPRAILGTQLRYPIMSAKVVFWIYFQALKLWLKKTPFYPHPDRHSATAEVANASGGEP